MLRIDDTDDSALDQGIRRGDHRRSGLARPEPRRLRAPVGPRWRVYSAAAEKLKAAGRLYPCYETAAELDRRRKRQMAARKPPIYDRAALELTAEQRASWKPKAASRIGASSSRAQKVRWTDLIRGPVEIDTATMSDPVLIREDGASSTPCRRWSTISTSPSAMSCAARTMSPTPRRRSRSSRRWARPVPTFAHFPLLVGAGGEALSKRLGSLSLRQPARGRHRAAGARLLSRQDRHLRSGRAARCRWTNWPAEFDFAKIGRAPAHFDAGRTDGAERQTAARHALRARWQASARRACRAKRSGTRSSPT